MSRRDDERLALLWPPPRNVRRSSGEPACRVPSTVAIEAPEELDGHVRRFVDRVARAGLAVIPVRPGAQGERARIGGAADESASVRLELDARAPIAPEGYELTVSASRIELRARDRAGAGYALGTLAELVELFPPEHAARDRAVPALRIDDSPAFARRGVLLDVSRTRVPTQATLYELVDLFARLRINELQLYTEHAYAYAGHEIVWRDASPMTGADVDLLDRYARDREIELVANQQSFGHLHRWLAHDRYRSLAEAPEGIDHAFSRAREPYGLCPTDPSSLAFLSELYDELFPHFSGTLANVGFDEPIDLGLGRSRDACRERGAGRVYLEFLRKVHALVTARGKRMQFFGDALAKYTELARELPEDCVVLEWGYDADHPFEERCAALAASGRDFYVCPGTSSWQSLAGRTDVMLANVRSAARAGAAAGASGYLITDWGDRGHLQPSVASHAGWCAGAGYAWNASALSESDARAALPALLDRHVYDDEISGGSEVGQGAALGEVACALGDAYRVGGARSTNGSPLFFLVAFADQPFPHPRIEALTAPGLERTLDHVARARAAIASAPSRHPRAQQLAPRAERFAHEWRWAADMLAFACRLGAARLDPSGAAMRALERELAPLIEEYRRLWRLAYRPGGLTESSAWLERCLRSLDR